MGDKEQAIAYLEDAQVICDLKVLANHDSVVAVRLVRTQVAWERQPDRSASRFHVEMGTCCICGASKGQARPLFGRRVATYLL